MLAEAKNEPGRDQGVTFTRAVQAPVSEVYRAFTHPVALRDWLCEAAEVEARAGGRFYLGWDNGYYTAGQYTEAARGERVGFTWRGPHDSGHSQVLVALTPEGEGTTVTVTHAGAGAEDAWTESAQGINGWETALENLQSILETGIDLRLVRRPMFGLSGATVLNAEMAAELGVPVEEGLLLTGLAEGLAAHNAGLQPNDVLVSIGDRPVRDYGSLVSALGLHQAGDCVPAVFYRGGEQHTVTLQLSPRQMPQVPETMQALAEAVRSDFEALSQELDTLVEGVSEQEAEYRRTGGGWNAREVLAHLIASEYDGQVTIANLAADAPEDPAYYANDLLRLRAMVAAHGNIADMAQDLKRAQQVTAEMIANMPPPASERKRNIFRLGLGYGTLVDHTREHFGEIKALVAAARTTD
ncbi:MAG: SRPBCC domain-containing protein [Chloroflexota bacterium]|nr:SRPBCC domain-containing protein [Chloroflexota bacterium]MDQ5867659.1 SRPBCC domain-containing protein [Chloroflexota bacterium]